MDGEVEEVKIIGVDKERIGFSTGKNVCWVVPLKLSVAPNESWRKKFGEVQLENDKVQQDNDEVQQENDDDMKRNAHVDGNFLKVEMADADDLQQVLDALKVDVEKVNVLCEEEYQQKVKIRQELEALQKKRREETQRLKDDSDKLTF